MKTFLNYFTLLLLIAGCASKSDVSYKTKGPDEKVLKLDVDKDGNIDCLWAQNLKDPKKPITLWRKDDLNFDGKYDIEQYYNNGIISRENMDLDFDGIFDAHHHYDEGMISKSEYSMNSKGKIDLWLFYKAGAPVKKEVDTNKSGKADYFEFYKDSKIDRIGRDSDGDGIIDIWE